jgi:putative flippase GtrA
LSFLANHRFTFGGTHSRDWRKFLLFTSVALVGMASTWLLSLLLRYGAHLDAIAGKFSATLAFAVATLLSSTITYPLNALLVFRKRPDPIG